MGDPEAGTVPPWAVFVPRDTRSVDVRAERPARWRRELAGLPDGAWVEDASHRGGIGVLRWAWTRWWAAERVVLARRT